MSFNPRDNEVVEFRTTANPEWRLGLFLGWEGSKARVAPGENGRGGEAGVVSRSDVRYCCECDVGNNVPHLSHLRGQLGVHKP